MKSTLRRSLLLWNADRHSDAPYAATLTFRPGDPYAVELVLPLHDLDSVTNDRLLVSGTSDDPFAPAGQIRVRIPFSRALLLDGLYSPTGEGVVRVGPHDDDPDYVVLTLPLTDAGAPFYANRDRVEAFLDDTLRAVPLGAEIPIADAALDAWLAEVAA